MKIEPINQADRKDYTCSPCWRNHNRVVEPTVMVTDTYGALDWSIEMPMCSNHAELLQIKKEKRQ